MVIVSREDIATGSLEAYKNLSANLEQLQVNLEGVMVNMIEKAKENFKSAVTNLKAVFGNMHAMAQLLKKEVATLEKDIDSAKANEIVAKDFAKAGLAADAFKDGNVAAVIAFKN